MLIQAICLDILKGTCVQCTNGHLFCRDCLRLHLTASQNRTCPTCRVYIENDGIRNKMAEQVAKKLSGLNDVDLDFNLSIGGFGTENYINFLKQKMNEKVLKRSNFLGYVEDQSKFFENIDIFVFPSYSEGLGLVLLEAMSYQKVCITRNVKPMNQFINDENGYLFNNTDDLKQCILEASKDLNNEKIINEKIHNLKKVLEIYDIKNVFPKILEVYNL